MKLVLPKLDLVVLKDAKANEDDARKFIHVIARHAVVQNGIAIAVDLREYIKRECEIEDDHDFKSLDQILNWMEGKSFTADFWKELTTKAFVELHPDGLKIENLSYNKILEYEDVPRNINTMTESLKNGFAKSPVTVDRVAVNGVNVDKLNSVFKREMKQDCFIFDFCGKENSFKFQAQRRADIFGLLPVDYNASCELTAFIDVVDFSKILEAYTQEF